MQDGVSRTLRLRQSEVNSAPDTGGSVWVDDDETVRGLLELLYGNVPCSPFTIGG